MNVCNDQFTAFIYKSFIVQPVNSFFNDAKQFQKYQPIWTDPWYQSSKSDQNKRKKKKDNNQTFISFNYYAIN